MKRRTFLKWLGKAGAASFIGLSGWFGASTRATISKCGPGNENCTSEVSYECVNNSVYKVTKTTCRSKVDGSFCSYGETRIKQPMTC